MDFFSKKNTYYELRYLVHKFKPRNLLLLFFTLLGSIIVGLGDTQGFFIGDASPIPARWTFFKKPSNARAISILVLSIPALSLFITEGISSNKETNIISDVTYKVTSPLFEEDLNRFHEFLRTKYGLSDTSRIYILIPIRQKLIQWNLQIIARTKNLNERENEISLALNEGVIGYVFQGLNYNDKNKPRYIPFKDVRDLPANFINYDDNNKTLIRSDNIGYLILPIFDSNFLSGLLVVDTNNEADLDHLQNPDIHEEIFNWIGSEPIFLTLMWRLSNYGNKQ